MNDEVTVQMPIEITAALIRAVKNDPLCTFEDKDVMNTYIGWLVCAYEAMARARTAGEA